MVEAIAAPQIGLRERIHNGIDQLSDHGMKAGALALSVVALGAGLKAEAAEAQTTPVQPVETAAALPSTVTLTFKTETSKATVKASDIASDKLTLLANIKVNGMPKKLHRKLEKEGKCKTVDGRKQELYSKGYNVNNKAEFGRDYRKSRVCWIAEKNGKGHWERVACGNEELIKERPKRFVAHPVWVKTFNRLKFRVNAETFAAATCEAGGAKASALAMGRATATGYLRTEVKASKSKDGGVKSLAFKTYNKATASASSQASAEANCEGAATTVTIVEQPAPPAPVCPEGTNFEDKNGNGKIDEGECVVPKDGTQGAGEGTGGPAGGTGSGGEAGDPNNGEVCRDTTDPNTGDHNAETEGDIVTGHPDQFGYCS
jgi:hypothetical protein